MKIKTVAYLLFGLTSFWIGTYLFSTLDAEHWARFPTFMTTSLLTLIGAISALGEATK